MPADSSRDGNEDVEADESGHDPDVGFRSAVAGYAGVLLAATTLLAVAILDASRAGLVGATVGAFAIGAVLGWFVSSRVPNLSSRLGRTRRRRAAPALPAVPLVAVGAAAMLGQAAGPVAIATLAALFAVLVAGYALSRIAQTRSVDAVIDGEPLAVYRWEPPRSPVADRLLLALWLFLAAGSAYAGDWFGALVWGGSGLFWAVAGLAEGRFRLLEPGVTPELRIHEAGLVKQRPYSRSFVPWEEVDHVRLREDELVLDRGLFDVRFGRDELESDALEDVLGTLEERRVATVAR